MFDFVDRTVVRRGRDTYVLVSTVLRPEFIMGRKTQKYETMVFWCDREGWVKNYRELQAELWNTEEEARSGHKEVCDRWR